MSTITIQPGDRGADYVYLTDGIKDWLIANNVKFVCRYFVKPTSTRINKDIKVEEIAWLAEHEIAIIPNFERHHNDSDGGTEAARRNGPEFIEVLAAFEVPTEVPGVVSIDTDIYFRNIDAGEAYVRQMKRYMRDRPLGLYGDDDIAFRCQDINSLFWRANATGWDGEPRPVTVHAQQHRALYPPGVDPNTCVTAFTAWAPWLTATPEPTPPTPEPPTPDWTEELIMALPDLHRGDPKSKHVLNAQALVNTHRADNRQIVEDGIFGPQTEDAVTEFQTRNSLHVDGWVGKQTWTALIG